MNDYVIALAFAALPALGNFVGGLLAEAFQVSERALNYALHAAAGVLLAIVAVELMPQALETASPVLIVAAFVAGGLFFIVVERLIGFMRYRLIGGQGDIGPWVIFFGVAVDLFSDGLMIGTGSTLALSLGLLLALGQVPADVPEGFATIATFKRQGTPRATRLLLSAAFAIPIFLGTTIGYWAVRGQPEVFKLALLAFTAGVLITVAMEELAPEAHESEEAETPWSVVLFVGGFALFTLLATYFE